MLLIAIKEHGYRGRRIARGQKFEVTSPSDIYILQKAGLAKQYVPEKSESQSESKPVISSKPVSPKSTPSPAPPPASRLVGDEDIVEVEDFGETKVETRDETPEPETDFNDEADNSSSSSRKQKRQYKRKDMVPEK